MIINRIVAIVKGSWFKNQYVLDVLGSEFARRPNVHGTVS